MKEEQNFYIVDKSVLPEVFLKVMEVKKLLESGKERTVQDAAVKVGISRSAFYENTRGKTVTISMNLDHTPGLLSSVLNGVAMYGANVLTINQTIPINGIANVTLTIETNELLGDLAGMMKKIKTTEGIQSLKIIARES